MSTHQVNLAHVREPHQQRVMERIVQDGICPFCREHLEKYHTKPILFETPHWVATTNFAPYPGSRVHFLLIAQQHCTQFEELSPEAHVDLFTTLARLKTEYRLPGGTIIMRWGDTDYTGGSVSHLHAQLVSGVARHENAEPIVTMIGYATPPNEEGR